MKSFTAIIALTMVFTCTMFALLSMRPDPDRYECNCAGYPRQKSAVGKQLFSIPVMLYSALPPASHNDADPCIE